MDRQRAIEADAKRAELQARRARAACSLALDRLPPEVAGQVLRLLAAEEGRWIRGEPEPD